MGATDRAKDEECPWKDLVSCINIEAAFISVSVGFNPSRVRKQSKVHISRCGQRFLQSPGLTSQRIPLVTSPQPQL